jgi:hypothetical protein
MTKPKNSGHHTKVRQEETYHSEASTKGGGGAVATDRTAYREEYEHDYGPDLDEPLDGTESGHEFCEPAMQVAPY